MDLNNIAKYLYEVGQLKRVKRAGWWTAGITDPESVAEHSFRVAILGYILASLDGADPLKTATMCIFHDVGEARIGDFHRIAKRYTDLGTGEERAFTEQTERLPHNTAQNILSLFNEYEERASHEGLLARDADLLECIMQAREYQAQGYADVQDWIDNCYAGLRTPIAKTLADACLQTEPKEWWQGLKKNDY